MPSSATSRYPAVNLLPRRDTVRNPGPPRSPAASLTLGVSPIVFSSDRARIGRLDPDRDGPIADLRRAHWRTHAFRFDARDGLIANIGLHPDIDPLGEIDDVPVNGHLLLFAVAIEHALRRWFSGVRRILKPFRPIVCLGDRDHLLTTALKHSGVPSPDSRLDVVAKWSFDLRLMHVADSDDHPYLGLIADVGTSNVIDIPVSELLARGFDPTDCYVGTQGPEVDDLASFSPRRLIGRVRTIQDDVLALDDVPNDADTERIRATEALLEPRRETLDAVTRTLYPSTAAKALSTLRERAAPYVSGKGKLTKIAGTVDQINSSSRSKKRGSLDLRFTDGLTLQFDPLLDQSSPRFPPQIDTNRPTMLFGASGHEQHTQPDLGIQRHGPFHYSHNATNDPMVVVLAHPSARGRIEQFTKVLRDGLGKQQTVFSGGLIGKFRLTSVRFHYAEIAADTAQAYADAATTALHDLTQTPAMALVQIREAHRRRLSADNPYYVAKARFMRAGVPVQAVRLETIERDRGRAYTMNNLALASYAKLGGVPWVISTPGVATHELVIGIGSTQVGQDRLGKRTRYVGFTTLFQGDGRYLVWETTREATFEEYPNALLASLRNSIRFVRAQNRWEPGDSVRLVFHVYKPLKRVEIETVKRLVNELLKDYPVKFAFIDISEHHPLQIFDPRQQGVTYRSFETNLNTRKGIFAPQRGTALLLSPRTALLQLVGANEVKTSGQGLPRPLLLELHPDSDFSDLTYLVRQAFHFSFMSWRSFFPSHRARDDSVFPVDRTDARQSQHSAGVGQRVAQPTARPTRHVVPVVPQIDVLASRRAHLWRILRNNVDGAPAQVQGFVERLLPPENDDLNHDSTAPTDDMNEQLDAMRFHGYPALARAGFGLAHRQETPIEPQMAARFLRCIDQQRERPPARQAEFAHDTLALLGVADGLRALASNGGAIDTQRLDIAKRWTGELLERHGPSDVRFQRARLLAIDLLDDQGRFGTRLAQSDDPHVAALDLCLWQTWSDVLRNVQHPDANTRRSLFSTLLTAPSPDEADVLHAAICLCALAVLTNDVAAAAVPDSNAVARILRATQGSFRRWRWEAEPTRRNVAPTRWIIDKEADVQALLLAILSPYFRDDLEDEQYLPGFGLRQGRFDFAVPSLRLIVEVKLIRHHRDISAVEAQIADDLALYFKPGGPFSDMIVYIYDDRDEPQPENYPTVRDALLRRDDRIVDVVIVRRPSMIPDRDSRSL